jgi:enamine deaminase RidA (YjgF/YER057c/UK114 family)
LSYATRVGDLLFVSGIPGFDDTGKLSDDFATQFAFVAATIKRILAGLAPTRRASSRSTCC